MPIGFPVASSDVVIDYTYPFKEPYKAASKFSAIVCPGIASLAAAGNHIIIQELGSPFPEYQGHNIGLYLFENGFMVARKLEFLYLSCGNVPIALML